MSQRNNPVDLGSGDYQFGRIIIIIKSFTYFVVMMEAINIALI